VARLRPTPSESVLVRADSAFYGSPTIGAAVRAGAQVSVTVRLDATVKAAIASIAADAWTPIEYTDAVRDPDTGTWISAAQVAEVPFVAFSSQKAAERVAGRLVVRRIPDLNPQADDRQHSLFDVWRFHAFFTTSDLDTVTADKTHRGHAIIEQVNADLKNSALAHLPSGKFTANAAWLALAVMAFNLTRAAATIAGGQLRSSDHIDHPSNPHHDPGPHRHLSPGECACTCPRHGPGNRHGPRCSTTTTNHPQPPPDHPANDGTTGDRRTRQPSRAVNHAPTNATHHSPTHAASPEPIGGSRLSAPTAPREMLPTATRPRRVDAPSRILARSAAPH